MSVIDTRTSRSRRGGGGPDRPTTPSGCQLRNGPVTSYVIPPVLEPVVPRWDEK
jgi:hypothetical protein